MWTPDAWGTDRVLDYTADDVLVSGGLVTAFVNQVVGGPNATQANAALQAAEPAARASLNGALAVLFTADAYVIADINDTATDHACFLVVDNQDATTVNQYAYDAQTGRLLFSLVGGLAGYLGKYQAGPGADGWAAGSLTGAHRYGWSCDGVAGTMSGYKDGVALAGTLAYTAMTMDAAGGFGGAYNVSQPIQNCYVGRMVALRRKRSAADETKWGAWTLAKYGV